MLRVRAREETLLPKRAPPRHRTIPDGQCRARLLRPPSGHARERSKPLSSATATLDDMAEEDEPEPDEPTPGETDPGAGGANGWGKRFRRDLGNQRFRSSTSPGNRSRGPHEQLGQIRAAVNYLDQTERRIAVMATIFELALTLSSSFPTW